MLHIYRYIRVYIWNARDSKHTSRPFDTINCMKEKISHSDYIMCAGDGSRARFLLCIFDIIPIIFSHWMRSNEKRKIIKKKKNMKQVCNDDYFCFTGCWCCCWWWWWKWCCRSATRSPSRFHTSILLLSYLFAFLIKFSVVGMRRRARPVFDRGRCCRFCCCCSCRSSIAFAFMRC